MVNFLFQNGWGLVFVCMCAYVCVVLNVSVFGYVHLLARTYRCMFAYILACIFTYIHIFSLFVVGKREDEGRGWEKRRVGEERVGNGVLQSE